MIVRELATLLNFKVDQRGAQQYDQQLNALADRASRIAAGIGAALGAAFGIDKIIEAGDAYTSTMNRLGSATAGPEQASEAFEKLYSSARETGVAVDETSKAFMRFSPAMQRAGYGMDDTIGLIDGIQKGLLAAGATAAETSSVFLQLGQAINSGTFAGDELRSFLEGAPPSLVNRFAEAVGTTSDKLKEMGSKGELTAKNVLPALIEAAKAGRDEFGKMQVTVGLATARSRIAMDRFLAEFERAFDFTRRLAALIDQAGKRFDEWRQYIPTIRAAVDELGGLDQILSVVALGTIYLTGLFAAMNGTLSALLVRVGLLSAQFLAVVAAGLLLQDFFTWMSGSDTKTLFGEMFGPAKDVIGPYKPLLDAMQAQLQNVKDILVGTPDEAIAAWTRLKDFFSSFWTDIRKGWPDWLNRSIDFAAEKAGAIKPVIDSAAPAVSQAYKQESLEPIGGWIKDNVRDGLQTAIRSAREMQDAQRAVASQEPAGGGLWQSILDGLRSTLGYIGVRQQVQQPDGTLKLLQPGESMRDAMNEALMRRAPAPPANLTVNQTNNNTVNTTVNATGTSGAEMAAGAERGTRQGAESLNLDPARVARDLRSAIPAYEGAGGTAP